MESHFKPLFNFKANNFINAYILNAICASLAALAAIRINAYGEKRHLECKERKHKRFCNFYKNRLFNTLAIILTTFLSTLVIYLIMNLLFGYGGGMIAF